MPILVVFCSGSIGVEPMRPCCLRGVRWRESPLESCEADKGFISNRIRRSCKSHLVFEIPCLLVSMVPSVLERFACITILQPYRSHVSPSLIVIANFLLDACRCGHCKRLAPVLDASAPQTTGKMAIGTVCAVDSC